MGGPGPKKVSPSHLYTEHIVNTARFLSFLFLAEKSRKKAMIAQLVDLLGFCITSFS